MRRFRWAFLLLALAGISLMVVTAPPAHAANRNIVVHFTNNSNSGLTLSSYTLDGGCWTGDVTPPQTISVGQSVDIASESCGFLTGTEFHVSYTLDLGGATMSMHYNNPEGGSDDLDNTAPPGYAFTQSTGVIEDHTTIFGCDARNCHRIVVHVTNNSDSALTLASPTLDHGCWTVGNAPPPKIAIGAAADIAAEMCGDPSAEFHVSYTLDLGGATMSMHYASPAAAGGDVLDNTAPQGYLFQDSGPIEDHAAAFGCNSTTCDGIPDAWKVSGVTIDPGGGNPPQFVNLPAMGVALDRPNVLVQLDWMADSSGHNQQLSQAAIDTVIKAFNADPVTYHGATRSGITLIVDNGPNSTITPGGATWGSLSAAQSIPWTQDLLTGSRNSYTLTNFYTLLKSNFVPTGRLPIFHYAIAGAEMSGTCGGSNPCATTCYLGDATSGLTTPDLLGFMVTLGDWTSCVGSQNEQTGTFMHELGHALGLDHSGGEGNGNNVNYKPNYPSIMNYMFQTVGVPRGGKQVFDYSQDPYPNLDETTLTEAGGVNLGTNPSGSGTGHACVQPGGGLVTYTQQALSPVDWSCDKVTPNGGTGFDGNGDGAQGTLKGTTASDWNRIRFKTGGVGAGAGAKDTVTVPSSGVSGPVDEITYEMARLTRVLPLATKLSYTGAITGDYHDPALVSAKLTDPGDPITPNSPIDGKAVTFQLGSSPGDTCSAVTDAAGRASCIIVPTQVPGTYPVTATFDADTIYQATSAAATFTITKEQTALTLSGPTVVLAGSGGTTLSARLLEDGLVPPSPAGQAVTFTLGGQSCTGTANANGDASCALPSVSGAALGPKTLQAFFAGDAYYLPSAASGQVIVFAFPATGGTFVLGDTTVAAATPTTTVTFWGAQWSKGNRLSGGSAPDAFKGFAGTVSTLPTTTPPTACAGTWTSSPGNSSQPPGTIPSYMGVIVTTNADKSGPSITGRHVKIVVVKTDPGYGPSPGHAGSGKIVATFCG